MSSQTEHQKKLTGFFAREYQNLLSYVKRYWRGDEETGIAKIIKQHLLKQDSKHH